MDEIRKALARGEAVILPTETVYGLFAKALDQKAVDRVYQLKKRPRDKAMNLNVADLDGILAYSKDVPSYLEKLYQAFLPGPLTIILKANDKVPDWINSGMKTVGFRIPSHPVTLSAIRAEGPLIGPSANISGQDSGQVFGEITPSLEQMVLGYSDDEAISGQDSTILDISNYPAKILRQGAISQEMIKELVPEIVF